VENESLENEKWRMRVWRKKVWRSRVRRERAKTLRAERRCPNKGTATDFRLCSEFGSWNGQPACHMSQKIRRTAPRRRTPVGSCAQRTKGQKGTTDFGPGVDSSENNKSSRREAKPWEAYKESDHDPEYQRSRYKPGRASGSPIMVSRGVVLERTSGCASEVPERRFSETSRARYCDRSS